MSDTLSTWLAKLEGRHPREIDLGLERCASVYETMGSPAPAPHVFTVAGTNGKGSVVAYLSAILTAMGMRCATYTSPHLLKFNERISINGVEVSDRQLTDAFEITEAARRNVSLTYFEFTTLAAFRIMSGLKMDVAILEVGLGGRLDTVNLIDPDCAVITNIGLDHQDYLGHDRESIGFEKAGIMRSGIPVICGDRQVPDSVLDTAQKLDAGLMLLGKDFEYSVVGDQLTLCIGAKQLELPMPGMNGRHQLDNLSTAVTAIQAIYPQALIEDETWKNAIPKVSLAGRLATIPSDPRYLLDVGHNPLAAKAVADYLKVHRQGRVFCILGMLQDKDASGVAESLDSAVDHWLCAGLPGSRGQSGSALADRIAGYGTAGDISSAETVDEAIGMADEFAGAGDLILVFGSFQTVGAAIRAIFGSSGMD